MAKATENTSNSTGKIIGALLVGAAVGGALGILFAPAKGSETRKKLMAQGDQIKDTLMEKFGGMMNASPTDVESVDASHNHSAKG